MLQNISKIMNDDKTKEKYIPVDLMVNDIPYFKYASATLITISILENNIFRLQKPFI